MKTGVTLAYLFAAGYFIGVGNLEPLATYGLGLFFSGFALSVLEHREKKSQKVLDKSGRVVVISGN